MTEEISKLKNGKIIRSKKNNYALWFGSGTKSILFDLQKKEKSIIWGHPTNLKGYIETIYPDCPKNFDLTNAVFAHDETYLVASALYGKLVAWSLPTMERRELVPNKEVIDKFGYNEAFSLNKQQFFKWSNGTFGNLVLEIFIIQNGEVFVTQTETLTLIWDNKFNNIGYLQGVGRLMAHSDKYLIQLIDNELTVYELESRL